MRSLIYLIIVILIIGWLLGGFAFHIGGEAIHIIIVIAIILLLLNLINGGRGSDRGRLVLSTFHIYISRNLFDVQWFKAVARFFMQNY